MTRPRRCVLCGHPCFGVACRAHKDYLKNDTTHYAPELRQTTGPRKRKRRRSLVEAWVGSRPGPQLGPARRSFDGFTRTVLFGGRPVNRGWGPGEDPA